MANKKDMVTVTCYGREETLSRSAAIKKYKEGMMCCEGAERERYTNIYLQLIDGHKTCSDHVYCN